ncbi:MAG: hypothetical protein H5T74_09575 [Actinobacteria bacterium]|nr:hypothetical protein [Actinomycetota bacterium]
MVPGEAARPPRAGGLRHQSIPLCSLRGGLSLGLYGFTFWAQDRGGFTGAPTDKLYIRFTKHCILKSHIRYHGGGPRFREPRNYRPETQDVVRRLPELRYRLIPYIYSEARHLAARGRPMFQRLVLETLAARSVVD